MIEAYDDYIYAKVTLIFSTILFLPIILICIGGAVYSVIEKIMKWRDRKHNG